MPLSSMRNGYSLVPWSEPRYFTTRRRRVEVCSVIRWSRKITQSETYSSRPWRVSVPSPFSPVMTTVMPRSLSQRNRRRSSERSTSGLGRPANSDSMVSRTTRLAPTVSIACCQPDEQALEVVLAGLLDLAALDTHVVDRELLLCLELLQVEAERGDVGGELFPRLLERHEDARLAVLGGPAHEELHGEQRLATAGAAADERRAAARQAATRDLVKSLDAGRRLRQRALCALSAVSLRVRSRHRFPLRTRASASG